MSKIQNKRPAHLKIARPTSLRPAAEPLSKSTKDLIREARSLAHSTVAAHGTEQLASCPPFLVREVSEVADSQGFQLLDIVRAIGRADTTPGEGVKEQKLKMAKLLCSHVLESPRVCEYFFTPLEEEDSAETTLFDTVLTVIEDTQSGSLAAAMIDLLVTVVLQVGLGLEQLKKMLMMLVEGGKLPRFAHLLLKGMTRMAAEQLPSSDYPSPLPQPGCPSPGSRTQARRRVAQFFVFDGARSGLCLGREEMWTWTTGYAFETWLWMEEGAEEDAVHVLRIAGESSKASQPARFALDLLVFQGSLHLQTLQGTSRATSRCPLPLPTRRWVHVVLSHTRNGLLRSAEAELWVDGQHSAQHLAYPKDKESGPVSLFAGCGDYDPRSSVVQFRAGKEEKAVAVKPFCGLMDRVRLFARPLTPPEAAALAGGDAAASSAVTRTAWSCIHPGGVLPLVKREDDEISPKRQNQQLKRTNAHREAGAAMMVGRKGGAMLGSLRVGGRMGLCDALECAGQVDSLVVLLSAALSLPAHCQLEEPLSSACPSPLTAPSPSNVSPIPSSRRRGSGGGQAGGRVAAGTLQLLATVIKKSAGAGERLWCGSLSIGVVLGAVWYVLHKASSEVMTGDVLVGVLALVDACWTVERSVQLQSEQTSARGKVGKPAAVVGRVAAGWLLGSEVWVGRGGEVQGLVMKELRNISAREPELMQEVWGLARLLDVLRDVLWADPRSCSPLLLELSRQRERAGTGMADGEKEWLRGAVAEASKYMCGANSRQGGFGIEEWQAVARFAASCPDEGLLAVVLGLAAEERGAGLAKAVGVEEWTGVMLGVLAESRRVGSWCPALSLLARRLAWASRSEGEAFVKRGGWSAVAERLELLEVTEEEEDDVFSVIMELLLASPDAQEHSTALSTLNKPQGSSLHRMSSSGSLGRQDSMAVTQYITTERVAVVGSHMLELLLSFLVPRSALLRQRGINDLVLLLERNPNNATALLQIPRWSELLVAMVGHLEPSTPSSASRLAPPAAPLAPSVVTWFLRPAPATSARWRYWSSHRTLSIRDSVTDEEDMEALLGLWQKLVAKLVPAMVQKKEGWKDLQQLLSAVARSRLPDKHKEHASMRGLLSVACTEVNSLLDGAERWDGAAAGGTSMGVVRDNLGGLLSSAMAEMLRRRVVTLSKEMLWEEWEREARAGEAEERRVLHQRLLQLVDRCFGKAGSPAPYQVTLQALCTDSSTGKKRNGELGPWLWPHAVWSLTMENMVGAGREGEGLRADCERLLRCLLLAADGDAAAEGRARAAVEVLYTWVKEAAPTGEVKEERGTEASENGAEEGRKRRMSGESWFGGIGGIGAGKAMEVEATLQGRPIEVMAGTGRLLASKVKGLPDLGQGWRGKNKSALDVFRGEGLGAALAAVREREEGRVAVRKLERELQSAVRSAETEDDMRYGAQREERRVHSGDAEEKARHNARAAAVAEEKRREEETLKVQGRVAYGRRCWKTVLKAQVHERTVWGTAVGMERALLGESMAGLLGGWWRHCWVQGGDRLRRRLKRNARGTCHAESAYDQSSTAVPAEPSTQVEKDGGVTPEAFVRTRSGSVGVKVRDRPQQYLGQGAEEHSSFAGESASLSEDAGSFHVNGSADHWSAAPIPWFQRTTSVAENIREEGEEDEEAQHKIDPLTGDGGDKWVKDGGSKGASAEEMLDWSVGGGGQPKGKALGEWECELVAAGGVVHGRLRLTEQVLGFEPEGQREDWQNNEPDVVEQMLREGRCWRVEDIVEVHGRRYMLKWSALELFFASGRAAFLNMPGDSARSHDAPVAILYRRLISLRGEQLRIHYLIHASRALARYKLTDDWVNRRISNLEYLMHLNFFAGRTYNDLTQYPVMPWVLSDYTSQTIDLSDPTCYRDLSKPIAAQSAKRVVEIQERYDGWCDPEIPAFHYGSHYSTSGWVLWYLLRLEPYTTSAVHLQGGRFDCPDRLFYSVADAYLGVTTSTNDVKELIPEFFFLPDFLLNSNLLDLGEPQLRARVDHVELPPWAEGSASNFVRINRQALESDFVSANLHNWIDLIFGHKQQGQAAVEALNVFFYLTYEERVDLESISDPDLRRATEAQIANFGQTPVQLFSQPHPRRKKATEVVRAAFDLALYDLKPDGSVHPPAAAVEDRSAISPFDPDKTAQTKPVSPSPKMMLAGPGDRCRSLPSTPQIRPLALVERTQSARSRSSEFVRETPLDRTNGFGNQMLGELVVRRLAEHGKWSSDPICFLHASSERLTAVTDKGAVLRWTVTARPSDGLPVTMLPSEPQPGPISAAATTPRGMARGVLGAATMLLGQGSGGSAEVRMGMLEVAQGMASGAGRQQSFAVVERGASRVLLTGGHASGVLQCYGVDGQGAVSLVQEVAAHQEVVTCMCLSGGWDCRRGGLILVTASRDSTVRVWSLGKSPPARGIGSGLAGRGRGRDWTGRVLQGTPAAILHGHQSAVLSVAADSELDVVVSGGVDGVCLVHSLSKGRYIRSLRHPEGKAVVMVQLSRDGEVFLVGDGDVVVHAVDVNGAGARSSSRVEVDDGAVVAMMLNNDHSLLFTAHTAGEVRARSTATLSICCTFPPLPPECGVARVLEMSRCGNLVLVGTDRGKVAAYTSDTAMQRNISFVLQHLGLVTGI